MFDKLIQMIINNVRSHLVFYFAFATPVRYLPFLRLKPPFCRLPFTNRRGQAEQRMSKMLSSRQYLPPVKRQTESQPESAPEEFSPQ